MAPGFREQSSRNLLTTFPCPSFGGWTKRYNICQNDSRVQGGSINLDFIDSINDYRPGQAAYSLGFWGKSFIYFRDFVTCPSDALSPSCGHLDDLGFTSTTSCGVHQNTLGFGQYDVALDCNTSNESLTFYCDSGSTKVYYYRFGGGNGIFVHEDVSVINKSSKKVRGIR